MEFFLNINTEQIQQLSERLDEERVKEVLVDAAADLSGQIHGYLMELARVKLGTDGPRVKVFTENLDMDNSNSPNGEYSVVLYKPALWVEDGRKAGEMFEDFLDNPPDPSKVHTSVDKETGQRYKWRVIPFDHGQAPSTMSAASLYLQDTLRKAMRQKKIPWKKVEIGPDGLPREGLLHSFDVEAPDHPHSRPHTPFGPGVEGTTWQGQGPKSYRTRSPWTGLSHLHGVRIYQKPQRDAEGNLMRNKRGDFLATRSIMTFRVMSEKQKGTGMWVHPGIAGAKLFDDAYEWAKKQFDEEIAPSIIAQLELD